MSTMGGMTTTWQSINRLWFLILLQACSSFLFEHDDGCSTSSSH